MNITRSATKQHVYIVRRYSIIQRDVDIKICKKMTWAIDAHGKRYLLGSTAFYTYKSARINHLAKLEKIEKNNYLKNKHPSSWNLVRSQIVKYKQETLH